MTPPIEKCLWPLAAIILLNSLGVIYADIMPLLLARVDDPEQHAWLTFLDQHLRTLSPYESLALTSAFESRQDASDEGTLLTQAMYIGEATGMLTPLGLAAIAGVLLKRQLAQQPQPDALDIELMQQLHYALQWDHLPEKEISWRDWSDVPEWKNQIRIVPERDLRTLTDAWLAHHAQRSYYGRLVAPWFYEMLYEMQNQSGMDGQAYLDALLTLQRIQSILAV